MYAAIAVGVAAVAVGESRRLAWDNTTQVGQAPPAAPWALAAVGGALVVGSCAWWYRARRRDTSQAARPASMLGPAAATLVLVPLLIQVAIPHGTAATLLAIDSRDGRVLWRVHPHANFLEIPTLAGDRLSVDGLTPQDPCQYHVTHFVFDAGSGRQLSGTPAGSISGPSRRITAVDAANLGAPTGSTIAPSPALQGPAGDALQLDIQHQVLTRVDAQHKPYWATHVPVLSERATTALATTPDVVYVAADGEWSASSCSD